MCFSTVSGNVRLTIPELNESSVSNNDKIFTPYAPFNTVRIAASDKNKWKQVLTIAEQEITNKNNITNELTNSCLVNFIAVSLILVGKKRTMEIYDALTITDCLNVPIIPIKKEILFFNVFAGYNVMSLNSKKISYEMIAANSAKDKDYDSAWQRTAIKVYECYIGKEVANPYDFNKGVIDSFEKEVNRNQSQVSEDNSFVYHVLISSPDYEALLSTSSRSEFLETTFKGSKTFYHSFILEQFLGEGQSVRTRLYQSWLNELSLEDHFRTKGYGEADEGCFDEAELGNFFMNLKSLLFCDEVPDFNKLSQSQTACFNVPSKCVPAPGILLKEIGVYSGLALRFMTTKINPKKSCQFKLP